MVSLNSRVKWPLTRGITKIWKWRFKLTFVWNCWHNYSLLWVIMTRTHSVLPALLTTLLRNSTFLLFSSSTKVFCFKLKLDISINPFLSSSLPTHQTLASEELILHTGFGPCLHLVFFQSRCHYYQIAQLCHCIHTNSRDWTYHPLRSRTSSGYTVSWDSASSLFT